MKVPEFILNFSTHINTYTLSSRNTEVSDSAKAFGSTPKALPLYYLRREQII